MSVRPYSFESPPYLDAATGDPDDLASLKFLLIDPVADLRHTLAMTLGQYGVRQIEQASRSGDALALIRRTEYDVVLCEYDLGHGFDGLFLFEEMRRHDLLKASCAFIIVTGERRTQKVLGAAELVPDAIVLKPFTGDSLYARLRRALRRKRRFQPIDSAILRHDFLLAIRLCNQEIKQGGADLLEFVRMKVHLMLRIADWAGVRDLCRTLLAKQDLPWARMALGKALFEQKQYPEAAELFQSVLAEHELVLEAYDWLARVQQAQGKLDDARNTVDRAVARSPFVVSRQRELGELAWQTGDMGVAQTAFHEVVGLSRYSFWRDPADHGRLIEVLTARNELGEARKLLTDLRRAFAGAPGQECMGLLLEAGIERQSGNEQAAREKLGLAQQRLDQQESPPDVASGMVMARALQQLGSAEAAALLMQNLLRNNHDAPNLAGQIRALYQQAGQPEKAAELIDSITGDIVRLNNEAVQLARSGDLAAAAELFLRAVADMPANVQIIYNTVNALLAYVNQHGWHASYMERAAELLRRASELSPANGRGLQLIEVLRKTRLKYGVAS
ncbi:tetratricopeptide repeat protein [Chitinilyticum piscinae]|uniref:Tetratricopeptide repeat protein n=1 Tax=Chitinilyticum piscinae TaxID=2866724 RepID=A0A8J7KCM6_9NEIS|nr:tetratricopeptide repeat protein [Chitinilyticum piscinae]MBE9607914.1 tetratricopeptide repeat protein [Chitinilyticum piscinae]